MEYTRTRCSSFFFASLLASFSPLTSAQPDAGQILRQQQGAAQPSLPHLHPKPEETTSQAVTIPQAKTTEIHVEVKAFHFSGAEGLATEQELQAVLADTTGKSLNFGELQQCVARVSSYLKNRGFFLSSAYLPKQDVTAGVIEIAITQGKLLPDAKVSGHNLRMNPTQLQAIANKVIPADAAVRMQDLERGVLLINELPGLSAHSQLAPGDQPNSTQWLLDVTEGPLVSSSVWTDNYGNRYTGASRMNARVSLNDPKQRGDQLSLNLTSAVGLRSQQVDYSIPISSLPGLSARLGYNHLNFSVGEELGNINSTGSAQTKTLGLNYPLILSRSLNVWGSSSYDWKFLKDKLAGVVTRDKQVGVLTLGLTGNSSDHAGGGGLNNFSFALANGNLDLSNVPDDASIDNSTAGTQGHYLKMNYSVGRLQYITPTLAFFSVLNGQYAGQNLDSSEKFILGGPSGIRAYPSGEGSGDRGNIVNLELRYDLPANPSLNQWGNWQLVTFFDGGQITLYDTPWTGAITNISGDNTYTLKGAGLGLNLTHGSTYAVHAAWAKQIGSNPGRSDTGLNSDGQSRKSTLWLQALAWF